MTEIDLKANRTFSVKSVIQNRAIIGQLGNTGATALATDETIAFVLFNPSVSTNITTGIASEYVVECSASENYTWWADFTQPAMAGIPVPIPNEPLAPTKESMKAITLLEKTSTSPLVPTKEQFAGLVGTLANMALPGSGALAAGAVNMITGFLSDSTSLEAANSSSSAARELEDPLEIGRDYTDIISWLSWAQQREDNVIFRDDLPEAILELIDEYD